MPVFRILCYTGITLVRPGGNREMTRAKRWAAVLLTLALLAGGGVFLWRSGFFAALTSTQAMQDYIEHFSPFGQCIFFVVQLLSVILAPIPSNITALAGAVLFGMWQSFFLTYAAVLAGSCVVFGLARTLGRPFADRVVSRKVSEKYLGIIHAKQDVFLLLVFLLPFFPDDVICILAGLTKISPLRFLVIAAISRPWGLLVSCAVGSATVTIPIWGMVLLGAAGVALLVVGLKFGDTWEQAILKKFRHKQ